MKSLEKISSLEAEIIFPGHGPVVNKPNEKISEYIKHRLTRENQIIDCIKSSSSNCGITISQIVSIIYKVNIYMITKLIIIN